MKETFEDFIHWVGKSKKHCPWVKDRKLEGFCEEILLEAKELVNAAKKQDKENLKEELGDILLDWAHACALAEEEGITIKEVIASARDKLKRRKPFILDGKTVTKEEATKIWFRVKEKEKRNT